jgi:hypothetical protein
MGMRSLWPKQPQTKLEGWPFAVRMQSFPSNLSSQRILISRLAGLFLIFEKLGKTLMPRARCHYAPTGAGGASACV